MLCGRMHARLYPQTRQNDSYDDRAATVPAPPSLPAHKWLLCASVNLGAETAGHDERGPIQQEMSALSGFDRSKTGEEEEEEKERGETALGSLAKSAGSIHSHPEFNILMCSWNRRSNKERDGEGERERGKEGGPFQ